VVFGTPDDLGEIAVDNERVWVHPDAVEEAQAAYEWYHARSPEIAEAFLAELDSGIELIAERPGQWTPGVAGTRRFSLRRFPYLVIFREVEESVQIVAIAHARRRPGYWRER
jgi:toxin ParE1/3/4